MTSDINVIIKSTNPVTVAFLPMRGPYTQVEAAFGRLYAWIGQKGYQPAGPPSGIYFNDPAQVPGDQLMWELRSPLAGDVPASDPDDQGVGVKKLAAARVASAIHQGTYESITNTYRALATWITQNGYDIADAPEEVYLSDPHETAPEVLLTEIRFAVRERPRSSD